MDSKGAENRRKEMEDDEQEKEEAEDRLLTISYQLQTWVIRDDRVIT